ncbi:MAG: hypothetical protein A2Z24_00795 [Candidatus Woykebacteria bacterium RBG_16_44_10]|uniref:Uncharacterized protein n=1 Tax=Candidatus Woykebacteria bacterium RBG_16_44_10 TaxID=1802597 RepID=A0A1G1WFQ4_9BACT|nr:MAG: hypothetical protein A2Z24_00795 [Candidatus Woykebacteria bacterium RBG_16_44_10]
MYRNKRHTNPKWYPKLQELALRHGAGDHARQDFIDFVQGLIQTERTAVLTELSELALKQLSLEEGILFGKLIYKLGNKGSEEGFIEGVLTHLESNGKNR